MLVIANLAVLQVKKKSWVYFRSIAEISNRLLLCEVHHIQRSADRKFSFAVQFFYPAAEIKIVTDKLEQEARKQGEAGGPTMEAQDHWSHALIRTNDVGNISHRDIVGVPERVFLKVCFGSSRVVCSLW